ncbi:hypothetical protein TSO352_10255 [Azospirillum sp. TSO35-2]|nr:hypothetical protein TSO352_10255 [Azospirillum sp. TSO35-2]
MYGKVDAMDGTKPIPFDFHAPRDCGEACGLPVARSFDWPCDHCPTREDGLCRLLSHQDRDRLFPHGPHIQLRKAGATLFRQGDPLQSVFILKSGWVMTSKMFENGQRQIIRFALPGDLLGFEGDEATGMTCSAEAITDVTLCKVRHALFFHVCTGSPRLAMTYAGTLTREVLSAWNHLGALGQQPALGRVANLLLDLHRRVTAHKAADQAAHHAAPAPAVHLPISQIHIADATGLTSVHVCRTLKQMRKMGLLDFQKGWLVLLDPERLAGIAQLDPAVPADGALAAAPWAAA